MAKITAERRRQNEEVAAFIRDLYEQASFKSWGEFARDSGMLASTISDYQRGENAPGGYNLLRLIWAATRRSDHALELAALNTDPVIAAAVRWARGIIEPLPTPDFDEDDVSRESELHADGADLAAEDDRVSRLEAEIAELRQRLDEREAS